MRSMRGMLGMTMMMASMAAMGESMSNSDFQSVGKPHIYQKTILTKKQKKNRKKSQNGRKANRKRR